MNSNTDLEQVLRVHFDNHADPSVLDGQLDRIVDRVATVRQRSGWMIPERWLPMSAISTRLAGAPRLPLRLLVVALLVLALAASVLLVAGALRHPVPAPFGLARNGLIAFADGSGAINVGDPVTGVSNVIVAGPGNDRPIFSPDGTRIAFLSDGARGQDIVVVRPDGSGITKITSDPGASAHFLGWSPDSASVIVGVSGGEFDVYDATRTGLPTKLGTSDGPDDYNAQTADLYRPPDGRKVLVLRTGSARPALIVSNRDGSNEQTLIDSTRSDFSFIYLGAPQWSPDGSMIAFIGATRDVAEAYFAYVMNADGTGLRPLSRPPYPINESNPAWSPDGTRIAVQRWFVDVGAGQQEARPITVVDVANGRELGIGAVPPNNGISGWGWSPDAESIMELTTEKQLIVANATTGTTHTIPWNVTTGPTWQRTAP